MLLNKNKKREKAKKKALDIGTKDIFSKKRSFCDLEATANQIK